MALTHYSGMLPVWSNVEEVGIVRSLFIWVAVFSVVALQSAYVLFHVVQLKIQFTENRSIHSVTFNTLWLFPFAIGFVVHVYYVGQARTLAELLHDWQLTEKPLLSVRWKRRIQWVRGFFYGLALTLGALTATSVVFDTNKRPEASYLLSYYAFFREPGMYPLTVGIPLAAIFFEKILTAMSDLVPSFFYFHVSLAVRGLASRIESLHRASSAVETIQLDDQKATQTSRQGIQTIRSDYNRLRQCVERANALFGPVIIFSHSLKFCLICVLSYKTLYGLANSSQYGVFFVNLIFVAYELVSNVLLISQLKKADSDFRGSYSDYVTDGWSSLAPEEKETAAAFSNELRVEQLAVKPSNLYTIQPELLLKMLGLVTTYTIILLQSG